MEAPPVASPIDYGERAASALRSVRGFYKLSQQDVADAMTRRGFSWVRSTVAKVESGARSVSLNEAVHLAKTLRVDLNALVGDVNLVLKMTVKLTKTEQPA